MSARKQRTLARSTRMTGRGLFGGCRVTLEFHPAAADTGILFQRVDLPEKPLIPARIESVQPELRRTVLEEDGARVEMVEHVLAALAGLNIDNCLVTLDAAELPNGDGSSEKFVAALLEGGIVEQSIDRSINRITSHQVIRLPNEESRIELSPSPDDTLRIEVTIDYPQSAIGHQTFAAIICPDRFVTDISFARTFVLEHEVAMFRRQGLGLSATTSDLLVFGPNGPIDNDLYTLDECARHKLLDCIGDFALLGSDIVGQIRAFRPGHRINHEVARTLSSLNSQTSILRVAG